ncbi:acyl-CoA thioester hydrolase/BAAT C-terminal domain-containing protein [Streptomyces sp. NPDC093228]|uniref:acyl-CoA thioester hydrolase/BAAT C-terminal domain-containing protein n=1 Tax=unclassified Streptomyces TaxID=2593676 RepID=UPI000740CB02|nr:MULTISPECIES: acyl-CoA thioester hydrolase/BAAT C-terminal domain-containing protein [unclassified Streptomyces]KUJ36691.1 acyl-CoA thioesterase [Streptomyces sp. NRRL F-5122]MDX3264080.1 acyl-CoA thioester hydrolase/BAAT C-terminal domain-containing protein [Streptomyces sp. MI02-2A]
MEVHEREVSSPCEGLLVTPVGGGDAAVVVLAGSSGRVERERARILARHGVTALAIRWFGGPGQPAGICEIPLETFTAAVDVLRSAGARRIAVLGVSKGAEAALLTAVHDPRVDVVIAVSPTSRVWCNVGPGRDGRARPYRSSWTWRGEPLPFMPMDDTWTPPEPHGGPVAVRGWYEHSERTFAHLLAETAIPVERTEADILLVAGGDDAMWPSLPYAEELAARRRSSGSPTRLISRDDAGHRTRFPGESPAPPSADHLYGGTPDSDARLGRTAWPLIIEALRG